VAKGDFNRGWVMVEDGRMIAEGITLMRAALRVFRVTGDKEFMPHWLGLLAAAQAKLEKVPPALSLVHHALARVTRTGERLFEADLHRLAGDLLVALVQPDQAEESFHHAIAVARKQNARWWELRAATSLARLWAEQGSRAQAHDLLAPVYGWFTEGSFARPCSSRRAKAVAAEENHSIRSSQSSAENGSSSRGRLPPL
jgi:predicted ATPase